jgi:hypothetical protein
VKDNLSKAYVLADDTSAVFEQLLNRLRDRERAGQAENQK